MQHDHHRSPLRHHRRAPGARAHVLLERLGELAARPIEAAVVFDDARAAGAEVELRLARGAAERCWWPRREAARPPHRARPRGGEAPRRQADASAPTRGRATLRVAQAGRDAPTPRFPRPAGRSAAARGADRRAGPGPRDARGRRSRARAWRWPATPAASRRTASTCSARPRSPTSSRSPPEQRRQYAARSSSASSCPCVFVTKGQEVPPELLELATRAGVPVLRTQAQDGGVLPADQADRRGGLRAAHDAPWLAGRRVRRGAALRRAARGSARASACSTWWSAGTGSWRTTWCR